MEIMPNIKIEIKNLAEIRSAFAKSPRIMTRNLDMAIRRSALSISRQSRRNTPVATGRLRASTYERFSSLKAEIGTNTTYDSFVHEGTRFMKARPYLRSAVESEDQTIQKEFKNAVQDTLDELAKDIG
jgi:HK97 gp10 family phage protein